MSLAHRDHSSSPPVESGSVVTGPSLCSLLVLRGEVTARRGAGGDEGGDGHRGGHRGGEPAGVGDGGGGWVSDRAHDDGGYRPPAVTPPRGLAAVERALRRTRAAAPQLPAVSHPAVGSPPMTEPFTYPPERHLLRDLPFETEMVAPGHARAHLEVTREVCQDGRVATGPLVMVADLLSGSWAVQAIAASWGGDGQPHPPPAGRRRGGLDSWWPTPDWCAPGRARWWSRSICRVGRRCWASRGS